MIFHNEPQQKNTKSNSSILGMYASFAVLVFIVFGLAGTKSNWDGVKRYSVKSDELHKIEQKVKEKKAYLTKTEQELTQLASQEKSISSMIPQGGNFEKYVEEIVAANSGYGFDVEKVSFVESAQGLDEGIADVSITFGTKNEEPDLEGLVKSLEKTPRLSIIDRLSYMTVSDKQLLKVDLKIYLIK